MIIYSKAHAIVEIWQYLIREFTLPAPLAPHSPYRRPRLRCKVVLFNKIFPPADAKALTRLRTGSKTLPRRRRHTLEICADLPFLPARKRTGHSKKRNFQLNSTGAHASAEHASLSCLFKPFAHLLNVHASKADPARKVSQAHIEDVCGLHGMACVYLAV